MTTTSCSKSTPTTSTRRSTRTTTTSCSKSSQRRQQRSTRKTTTSCSKSKTSTRGLTRTSTGRRGRKECSLHSPGVRVTSTPPPTESVIQSSLAGLRLRGAGVSRQGGQQEHRQRRDGVGGVSTLTRCLSYRRSRGAGGGEDRDLCLNQPGHTQTVSVSCVKEQDTLKEYSDLKCSLSWRNKTQ